MQLTDVSMCIGSTSARLAPIFNLSLWIPRMSSFFKFKGKNLQGNFFFFLNLLCSGGLSDVIVLWCRCVRVHAVDVHPTLMFSPADWPAPVLASPPLELLIIWRWGSGIAVVNGVSPSATRSHSQVIYVKLQATATPLRDSKQKNNASKWG